MLVLKTRRRLYAMGAVAVGCAVWIYRRSKTASAATQTDRRVAASAATQTDYYRDRVAAIVDSHRADDICYNVLYTAAMYATDHACITLDTWTMSSEKVRVPVREWMLLKGREKMGTRALLHVGASKAAIAAYQRHRALSRCL